MLGLDRAGFWLIVDLEPDEVVSLLCRHFNQDYSHKVLRGSQEVVVNHSFINKFKVHPKGSKAKIEIYFNYPKAFNETNFRPLSDDFQKIFAEERIIKTLKDALGEGNSKWFKNFFDLEVAMQFKASSMHHYSKALMFIFRALSVGYKTKNKCVYSDYSVFFNKFMTTGFVFQLDPGIKLKIYGKTIENNKKNEKEKKSHIRGELTLTTNSLKRILGTTDADMVNIKLLKEKVFKYFSESIEIHKAIEKTFIEDIEHLKRKFKDFNPRELKSLVKDYEERALDGKVLLYVVEQGSEKSYSQIKRYRTTIRESLIENQERRMELKSNFKNIERIEKIFNVIFLLDIKILVKKGKEIRFILLK